MRNLPFLLGAIATIGCTSAPCASSADQLHDLLADAEPGDEVCIGAVAVEGTFEVPPGVTLRGAGPGRTVIRAREGVGIHARTEAAATTRLLDLTIQSNWEGIRIEGSGSARVTRVHVEAGLGRGLVATGLTSLSLSSTNITGPITPDNADDQPLDPQPDGAATYGLILHDVASADLTDVSAHGWGYVAVLFVDSEVAWSGGTVSTSLTAGIMVFGGAATIRDVSSCGSLQGVRLLPASGFIAAGDALMDVEDVLVCDSDGFGILHIESRGTYRNIESIGNDNAAIWVQDSSSFDLSGEHTLIADNSFGGVVICDSRNATVTDATISNTRLALRLAGEVGTVRIGDGIHIEHSRDIAVHGVTLVDNEKVGMIVDQSSSPTIDVEDVMVHATGTSLGMVSCGAPSGWDDGVTRGGSAEPNDFEFHARCRGPEPSVGTMRATEVGVAFAPEWDGGS